MPAYTFAEATPFLAVIFFAIVILWIFAVRALGKEYTKKLAENEAEAAANV